MHSLNSHKSRLLATTAITRVASVVVLAGAVSLPPSKTFAACIPLTAGADNVTCTGALDGASSDALAGNDTITIDTSVGNGGSATVSAGDDDDEITFNVSNSVGRFAGSDGQVLGDAGEDTIVLDRTFVGNAGDGTVSGGDDNDSISLSNISYVGRDAGSQGQVLGDAGEDTITLDLSHVGSDGAGTISGGDDNDEITLSNGSSLGRRTDGEGQVLGDAGNDTITLTDSYIGQNGDGTVDGGANNDEITTTRTIIGQYAGSTGQVLGDSGNDTITIDDSYVGLYGDATVSGGAGADSIELTDYSAVGIFAGATGQILGDAGNDTITIDNSYVGVFGDATVSGGAGADSIALAGYSVVGLFAGSSGQVLGDAGNDTITLDGSLVGVYGDATVSGGAGADSIALTGYSAVGLFAGSSGQVLGDAGNDTVTLNGAYIGYLGAATVDGGANNDSITLSNGAFVGALGEVHGGTGNDTIAIDDSVLRDSAAIIDGGADTDLLAFTANADTTITPGEFTNFEQFEKSGAATLTLDGNHTFADSTTVMAGTLITTGTLTSALTTVNNGAVLETNGGSFVGSVANRGTFSPGGDGTVETVSISGNFIQSAAGTLNIDVASANGTADKLDVGGSATLGGNLALTALGSIAATNQYVIIDAAGGVNGTFDSIAQSAAITQSVAIDGTMVVLRQVADFAQNAGTPNQISTGTGINAILAAPTPTSGNLQTALTALGSIADVATFRENLDKLHSEPYLAQYLSTWLADNDFATSLMSCPVADGAMSIGKEGQCIWAKVEARRFDQDRTTKNIGIDERDTSFSGGAQFTLNQTWNAGFGARYERVNANIDSRAETDGNRYNFAGSLKGRWGSTTMATVVSGGFAELDTTRFINLPGVSFTANGEQDIAHVSARARLAHNFRSQGWYLRPMVDLSATYIRLGSITETGAGNLGLNVDETTQWVFAATPALELGSEFNLSAGAIIRPYIRAGVTFLSEDDVSASTSFLGAPVGVDPFSISTEFDNVFATIESGVNIINADGMTFKLNYGGQFADKTIVHTGGAKLGFKF